MNRYSGNDYASPLPGVAYIRYSSEMQSLSFSLHAVLYQIKEQALRDKVEIGKKYFEILFKLVNDLQLDKGRFFLK